MFLIKETWVNATEECCEGDSGWYEPFTQNTKELFSALQREYGKCISKMYIDDENKVSEQVGWVFQKTAHYEDTNEPYIQETWIEVDDPSIFIK